MITFVTKIADLFYFPFIRKYIPIETFRYAFCGGCNLALDILLYFLVYHFALIEDYVYPIKGLEWLGINGIASYIAAFLIVFPITFLTGFWLSRNIAFRVNDNQQTKQAVKYLFVVTISLVINYISFKFFVGCLGFYPTPTKAITAIFTATSSYFLQKYFTFVKGKR